jgi:hypothetical protein
MSPNVNAATTFSSKTRTSLRKSIESDKQHDLSVNTLSFIMLHDKKQAATNNTPIKEHRLDKNRNPPIPTTMPANNDLDII